MTRSLKRCNNCGCYVAGMWLDGLPKFDCARYEEATPGLPCKTTKIGLLEMALRRQLVPDAFDECARIKPGRIIDVLEAERDAMRQAAALLGPMAADAFDGHADAAAIRAQGE